MKHTSIELGHLFNISQYSTREELDILVSQLNQQPIVEVLGVSDITYPSDMYNYQPWAIFTLKYDIDQINSDIECMTDDFWEENKHHFTSREGYHPRQELTHYDAELVPDSLKVGYVVQNVLDMRDWELAEFVHMNIL